MTFPFPFSLFNKRKRFTYTTSTQWPSGADGHLIINSSQTVNIPHGSIKDYSSITINSGGTLVINEGVVLEFNHTNINISNNRITIANHGLSNNQIINLRSNGVLPPPLQMGTPYYVKVIDSNNIELTDKPSGQTIDITDLGHKNHFLYTGIVTAPTIIGCSGDFINNGTIICNGFLHSGVQASAIAPNGKLLFFSIEQSVGGNGGNGGGTTTGTPPGTGGLGNLGYGGGGGGGGTQSTLAQAQNGSSNNMLQNNSADSGATLGNGQSGTIRLGGDGGGSGGGFGVQHMLYTYEYISTGGGGGGMKGKHGGVVYLRVLGNISGTGVFNFSGQNGFNGGDGGSVSKPQPNVIMGGTGGGGGGGAGGSGGILIIEYSGNNSLSGSFNFNGGSGGVGGQRGTSYESSTTWGQNGQNGSNGVNGYYTITKV